MKSQRGNIIGSIVTFYMIITAWLAGRRRNIGLSDWAALLVGLGGAAAVITLGVLTLHHPDENAPAGMSFFFGVVLLLTAAVTFACSLAKVSRAGRALRVASGACVLDYLLPRDLSS